MLNKLSYRFVVPLLLMTLASCATSAADRPNIIFIMVDDAGIGDFTTYGGKVIKTPVMDEMAREGMRFTQAYSGSAVCGPTRCVLMTGLHPGHCLRRANKSAKKTLLPTAAGTPTVASMLKEAGYATGGFGKWGLGNRGTTGVPEKLGFDVWYGYYDQVHAHDYYPEFLIRNSEEVRLPGNADGQKKTYTHNLIEAETLKFIEEHKDGPFFCYAAWTPPHGKYVIPEDDPAMDHYRDEDWTQTNKNYAAMVTKLDTGVGRVLAKLKELGIDDNTLVFYTSDNGANQQFVTRFASTGGLRGCKRSLYEGGTRAPSIARWPGRIAAGSTSDLLTTHVDLMATAAELARVEVPIATDGISIVPTLLGKPQAIKHPYLYFEIYEGKGCQQSVRKGDWKAYRRKLNPIEIYDLKTDPAEANDLAAQHPELVAEMEQIMIKEHVPSPHFIGPTQIKDHEAEKRKPSKKKAA